MQAPYRACIKEDLFTSESIYQKVCTLPSSTDITEEELSYTVQLINHFIKESE
jgi:dTDP-4-amino-4,6-dideoxygalactose transaminase